MKFNILLIEDNRNDIRLIRELLSESSVISFDLEAVAELSEGMKLLSQKKYDVVLLDIILPDSIGPDTFIELKKRFPQTPVIILTGQLDEELGDIAVMHGIQDFLVKGQVNCDSLVRSIRYAIGRHRLEEKLRTSESSYHRLFETAQDGILLLDAETQLITDLNPRIVQMSGFTYDEISGKYLWEIKPFRNIPLIKNVISNDVFNKDCARFADLSLTTNNGDLINVEFTSNRYRVNGKTVVQCNLRDITEKKKLEAIEQNHVQQSTLISNSSKRMNQLETENEISALLCEIVKKVIGQGYVLVSLFDDAHTNLSITATEGFQDPGLVNSTLRLLGTDPFKQKFPTRDMTGEELALFKSGKLELFPGGMYSLLTRKYPKPICDILEHVLNIRYIYTIGFAHHDHHAGGLIILCNSQKPILENKEVIEAIAAQSAALITRCRTESVLRKNEDKYRTLYESMAQGVLYTDAEGKITSANPAAERILGVTREKLNGVEVIRTNVTAIHEDGTAYPDNTHPSVQALQTGKPVQNVVMGIRSAQEKEYRWILVNAIPLFKDRENTPYQSFVTFDDITNLKHIEANLIRNQEHLSLAQEGGLIGSFEDHYPTGKIIWSPQLELLYGLKPGSFRGTHEEWSKYIYPDDICKIKSIDECINRTGEFHDDFRIIWPDGSLHWIYAKGKLYKNDRGESVRLIGINMDITERKKAEEDLLESETKYRSLVNNLKMGIYRSTSDEKGRFIEINKAVEQITGYSRNELLAMDISNLYVIPTSRKIYPLDSASLDFPLTHEYQWKKKDGTIIDVSESISVVRNDSGEVLFVDGIVEDVTERKQAAARVQEMETLKKINKAKSELLANVSHELRTPLASIKGNIETLIEQDVAWTKKEQLEFLTEANQEVDHLTNLIKDLLNMSRLESGKIILNKVDCSFNDILQSAATRLNAITVNHKLLKIIPRNMPLLNVDKVRISQVITNLVENAAKFSPEGSPVTIEAQFDSANLIISVEDKGEGISKQDLTRLFNRFFQAERVVSGKTRGTGLGLSISKGIVEAHGGNIWVESELGKGSIFSLSIPLVKTETNQGTREAVIENC
jgi:PAS domain S-box-containing protein